jgi:hypothetical protein
MYWNSESWKHYGFCIGNAIKYLWRAGLKHDELEDLKKAQWYIAREIARRERPAGDSPDASNQESPH